MSVIVRDMMSGPRSTWIGRLSAAASSSCSAVRSTQEKSRAMVRMPERPVRSSVFAILRAMPSKRAVRTASWTPVMLFVCLDVMARLSLTDRR